MVYVGVFGVLVCVCGRQQKNKKNLRTQKNLEERG